MGVSKEGAPIFSRLANLRGFEHRQQQQAASTAKATIKVAVSVVSTSSVFSSVRGGAGGGGEVGGVAGGEPDVASLPIKKTPLSAPPSAMSIRIAQAPTST